MRRASSLVLSEVFSLKSSFLQGSNDIAENGTNSFVKVKKIEFVFWNFWIRILVLYHCADINIYSFLAVHYPKRRYVDFCFCFYKIIANEVKMYMRMRDREISICWSIARQCSGYCKHLTHWQILSICTEEYSLAPSLRTFLHDANCLCHTRILICHLHMYRPPKMQINGWLSIVSSQFLMYTPIWILTILDPISQ